MRSTMVALDELAGLPLFAGADSGGRLMIDSPERWLEPVGAAGAGPISRLLATRPLG
jgi:hypothetical protein